jgi:hypothetical protein
MKIIKIKIMKRILCLFILLSNVCVGQRFFNAGSVEGPNWLNDGINTKIVESIDGHQYFLDEWGTGKIIINDSINAVQSKIQFNLVSGSPVIGKSSKAFILKDEKITGFVINNTNFIKLDSDKFVDKVKANYFVTPDFSTNNYLIANYSKILKEPFISNKGNNNLELNKKYETFKRFYILNAHKKYATVRLKEKDILKVLSDKEKQLKKYIKQNKLNLKNEKDVVKLITYYHTS